MIETRALARRYGETNVVDQVSLTLADGGVTALIGPNGAGKSTLLGMIGRLIPATSGQALVDGLDVTTTPGGELAKRLSILRQDNHVAARLTVRDLVSFGRYPHSRGRVTQDDVAHVARALAWLDLEALAERFLDELSGGQRQRAFVAMALAQDAKHLLLDEPLNNLDLKHSSAMMRRLRRMADELGKTIVIVLHDLNFASFHADRIIAMREGRVVADGSPREVIAPDALRAIYDMEIPVHAVEDGLIACPYR